MVEAVMEMEGDESHNSIKEIILRHIGKLSDICCKEFIKGYWEEKPVKVAGGIAISKVYHQDMRVVFFNAVQFLVWLCYPMSDEDFTAYIDNLKEEEDVDKRLKQAMETFSRINIMFDNIDFFNNSIDLDE